MAGEVRDLREQQQERLLEKLRRECGPVILSALADPTVVEIMLNDDGNLWVERLGQGKVHHGMMTPGAALALLNTTATFLGEELNERTPLLQGVFPIAHCRLQAVLPPAVDAPTFALRRPASQVFTLADYVESGRMTQGQADAICTAVRERKNILVAGATGSGKTTLTNAIYAAMAVLTPHHRLVLIEDTKELQILMPDRVVLRTTPFVDMEMLLKSVLRLRPDRIGVGEVRSAELYDLLKLWTTGHPGGLCTLHCESTSEIAQRMLQMCLEHERASRLPVDRLLDWIAHSVDLVVFIKKNESGQPPQIVSEVAAIAGIDPVKQTLLFRPV